MHGCMGTARGRVWEGDVFAQMLLPWYNLLLSTLTIIILCHLEENIYVRNSHVIEGILHFFFIALLAHVFGDRASRISNRFSGFDICLSSCTMVWPKYMLCISLTWVGGGGGGGGGTSAPSI